MALYALVMGTEIFLSGCGKNKAKENKTMRFLSVIVKSVERRAVDKVISVSGNVKAKYSAPLVFQTAGIVQQIFVKAGEKVTKGQVLVQLRNDHTKVQVQWAKVQLAGKTDEYENAKKMYAQKVWSDTQVKKARTEMESARLELEKAKVNDDNMQITAPFTGYVGFFQTNGKQLSPGSSVQQGQDVGKIVSDDTIVEFELAEADAEQVSVGQRVVVKMEGNALLPLATTVSAKEPFSDSVSHMVKFNADISGQGHSCQDGTFVKVRVTLKDAALALVVPQEAVVPDSGQHFVYVVKDAGEMINKDKLFVAKAIAVTPGPRQNGYTSIGDKVNGLEPGDLVITEPAEMVQDGRGVIITKQ